MEENKLNYDEITELMGKISKSMELSRKKQSDIDKKNEKLYKQTKILVVEDGKEEIEKLKQDKEEFDEMTVNSLAYSKEQVLIIKDELEQEFQQKLLDTMKKQKEIEGKLKSMLSRDLSDEKRAQVQESADKSANKLKEDMQAFQKQYFEKKAKLEEFDRGIESYALELGAEDRLKGISLSSIKKAREEASNLDKKDPIKVPVAKPKE